MNATGSGEKGADEIFCRSCGQPIKKEAEICPECGVRNEREVQSSAGARTTRQRSKHDPSRYETTVSDAWYWGVVAGVVFWGLGFAIFQASMGEPLESILALGLLVTWIIMPISIYFDIQYIRANSRWNPNTFIWVAVTLVWLVNIIAGAVFLYRRHEAVGVP